MEQVSTQLDFSSAENREHLLFFLLCEIGTFYATYGHTLTHAQSFLVCWLGDVVEVFRQVQVSQKVLRCFFDEFMIEKLHKYLSYDDFTVLNGFRFVAVEPTLFEFLGLSDLQIVFVVILHDTDHLINLRKPHMQQLLHIPQFNLNDVLCILGKGCASNLLSAYDLDHHLFSCVFGYFL